MNATTINSMPESTHGSVYADLYKKYGHTMRTGTVAELFHSHPSHIRAMAQDGMLPAIRVGSRWVFPTAKIAAMVEGQGAYDA